MKLLTPAILLAAGLAAAPGFAQETPEAWISRLAAVSKKPIELKQSMKLFIRGTEVTSQGELLYLDDQHFASRMEVETFWPKEEQRVLTIRRTVGDGQKQWNEMTRPGTGQGRVQDMSFKEVKARAKGDIYEGRIHPAQQLLALLDFTESPSVKIGETSVELVAEVTEEGKSKLVPMLGGAVPKKVIVELDRKTGFPRSWRIQRFTGETVLSFTFSDVRFPEADKVDRKRFVFQPSGKVTADQDGAATEDGEEHDQNDHDHDHDHGRTDDLVPVAAAQEVEKPAPPEKPPLPQEVRVWVDKIGELVGKSVEYDLSISTEIMAQGMPMQMSATGHIVMLDPEHMRASTTMSMEMEGMPAMVTTLLVVLDGKNAWIEVDNPMGKQYLRAGVDQMNKLQDSGMGGAPGASMNQLDQIRDLFENYYTRFKVEKAAGLVTITGDILPEMMKEMPQMAGVELKTFRMVLQEQTGFPVETSMSDGERDVMVFKLSNYKELKKEEVSAETFSYTPPPGVKVIDLGALLDAASNGVAEDDDF